MQARFYSVRRLAPFRGTLQVVELDRVRAFSADGVTWKLELLLEQPLRGPLWGSMEPVSQGRRYFSYGIWTARDGVKRVPVNALLGDQSGHPCLAPLLACLERLPALPFPAADHWEYWLLDREDRPLALLDSRTESPGQAPGPIHWLASRHSDHSFNSGVAHEPDGSGAFPLQARDVLERGVMQYAASTPRARWFNRERVLELEFPALMLREEWPDPVFARLVQDYFNWLSPLLLTLWQLQPDDRARLEAHAFRQAQRLHGVYRLIPEVMDQHGFDAALVEAVLRSKG